ncbi:MAG TPA: ATP-binding cassette domain-containing protein [Pyrinomonadaceae bacterium]|jgi:phospholipid/cholesterol/gamma-HCH transport system ATP-binding protein|nr:ATP-binding cassette domain-containing protein [Pyrinomonadaceae bacterium]
MTNDLHELGIHETGEELDADSRLIPAIEFEDVELAFDDQVILDKVSFSVHRGQTRFVLGGSGTGKSTIINLILGLIKPDAGRIFVNGEDITEFDDQELMRIRKTIGMIFQEGALFDSLSVYDNVAYRLHEEAVPEDEVEHEVRRMLRFIDLEDAIDKMPIELSGGMRRRVGIARALVGNPNIVLFDEPTAGLDPPTARTICELAIKLRDIEDVSSIFVTHEMNNLEYIASEYSVIEPDGNVRFQREGETFCLTNTCVMMLKDGEIIFEGKEDELRASQDPYIRRFIRGK